MSLASDHLTAFEYQPLPVSQPAARGGITPAEADVLTAIDARRRGFCDRGYRSVRLAQFCGLVSLGGRMLEILPKVDEGDSADECRGILLRMLRISGEFPLVRHRQAAHHLRHCPLLEIFIAAFLDAVADLIRGGMLRMYQDEEEDLGVVRGTVHLARQLGVNMNRPDRVACRFDELTADNPWNQILKAGLRAVRPWIKRGDLARRWVELRANFEDVEDVPCGVREIDRLVFDRQAVRYREAITWVRSILLVLSPDLRAGSSDAPGLLFDMERIFEAAVTTTVRRRGARGGFEILAQSADTFMAKVGGAPGQQEFRLRPDLLVREQGRVTAIVDVKWKRVEVSSSGFLIPASSDVYQMHAYGTRFGCHELALVYPHHPAQGRARSTVYELPSVAGGHPRLSVVCLDLADDALPAAIAGESTVLRRLFGSAFADNAPS